jgi:shikimate dehydrogenase
VSTFGLVGHRLSHSFSKGYFEAKFKTLGIAASYRNIDVASVSAAVEELQNDTTLVGVNVTIPFKTAIIPFLDAIDTEAKSIQAVNTIKVERIGSAIRLVGYNTDVIGFKGSIGPLLQAHHSNALILGTGGAAKAALHVLTDMGLQCLTVSREKNKGDLIYAQLTPLVVAQHTVIVNCTPVGMFPHVDRMPALAYGGIGVNHLLFDMVYNPIETLFLKAGLEHGATVCNGLEMLHLQAEASWEIWNHQY